MQRSLLSATLFAITLAGPATGQDVDPTEAIHVGLLEARSRIEAGELEEARAHVLALVREHEGSDALLLQLHRVKELLKRCAFRASHELPDATELIAGDLKSYDRRSGKIKVAYERDASAKDEEEDDDGSREVKLLMQLLGLSSEVGGDDFVWVAGAPMHPIVFSGPYTVEIKGVMPEKDDLEGLWYSNPQMVINTDDEGVYVVSFGYPRTTQGWYRTAAIRHSLGGKSDELDEDKGTPLDLGKKYSIKVVVNKKNITASANGRTFLKCKKQGDNYGQFGFRGCPGIQELILSGMANTAWVEGLEDTWWQKSWSAFDEVYDPMDELPPSLVARFGEVSEHDESPLADHPGTPKASHLKHHSPLSKMLEDNEYEKMLGYVEAIPVDEVGAAWHRWLMAVCETSMGHHDEALALCELLLEDNPEFVSGQLMRANLLGAGGHDEEALEALRGVLKDGNGDVRVHSSLATRLVGLGQFNEAQQVMAAAIDAGVAPAELERTAFMLTRAKHGPEWPEVYEFRTRNYLVRTDHSDKMAAEASKQLELSLSMYNRLFGKPDSKGNEDLYPVYLFSGQSGYMAYAGDLFGYSPTNTAGLYSPVLGQLLIWNLPNHDKMMGTVRHEGFHQYLDRLVDDPPVWFNEGTAEYVETASLKRSTMTPGDPVPNHVALLSDADTDWTPLAELVRMSRAEFYGKTWLHYGEAWALIHYLNHSGRKEKKLFDSYLDALLDGMDIDGAADHAFGDVDMTKMQREVRNHVRAMRPK
jgi:tetratricopeptide (TPR) repeat protein